MQYAEFITQIIYVPNVEYLQETIRGVFKMVDIIVNPKECCEDAQKAFILLDKIGIKNVSTMCQKCDTIFKLRGDLSE